MTTRRAPCPQCDRGPRDTALAVTTDERGVVMYCHRCGFTSNENRITAAGAPAVPRTYKPFADVADFIWSQTIPLRGSPAEKYLRGRGCRLPPHDGDLRYLPARGQHPAAMVGRVTDARTAEPLSLHFTHINNDGQKVGERPKRLLKGHRKSGGVIRLWPDEAVTYGLGIAEGIETALALAHAFSPVWSCIDSGNLTDFPVLHGIETLMIAVDDDAAGHAAAEACASRWCASADVYMAEPDGGRDLADVAAGATHGR